MIGFFVRTIGVWLLRRKYRKLNRKPVAMNFANVQSVGVLFTFNNETDFALATRFIKSLSTDEGIFEVTGQGYFPGKVLPEYTMKTTDIQLLTKKQFNWYGHPKKETSKTMLTQNFDVLIDLSLNNVFPVTYYAALANARMKVGKREDSKSYIFDLMIDISSSHSLPYLIEQIMHYVKMINSKQHATV